MLRAYCHGARALSVPKISCPLPPETRNAIGEVAGGELKVKVTAPPVDSAANEAVLRLLAEVLDCPRGAVQLVRGATARHKQVRVVGMSAETAAGRIESSQQRVSGPPNRNRAEPNAPRH